MTFYPHSCVITRETTFDESGELDYDEVYEGECCLQYPNSGNAYLAGNSQYQSSPSLMLPITDTLFAINDKVEVTVANGRVLVGSIEDFETIEEDDLEGTVLWLKKTLADG